MPNFNDLKTQSDTYFPKVSTVPAWKLNVSWNVWDTLIDYLAVVFAWFFRAEATANISVSASPFVYTAGTDSEVVYVRGGSVSAIEKKDSGGSWVSILSASNATVFLAAGQQLRVTYGSAPTMTKDVVGMFVNATGTTAALTPGSSPWTITNSDMRTACYYISGGVVSAVSRNGVSITDSLPLTVALPPSGALVITYTSAPTVVKDS